LDAYFELSKFSNNIRFKSTNENFEKCIDVINHFRILNKMVAEKKNRKLIYIINCGEKDFPFSSDEIYSIDQSETEARAIRTLNTYISAVRYKFYDYSKFTET